MKKIYPVIFLITVFCSTVFASSYRATRGSLDLKGVTLKLAHARVFNFRPKPRSFIHTYIIFAAHKGYLVKSDSYIIYNKKKVILKTDRYYQKKKGFYTRLEKTISRKHIRKFQINITVYNVNDNKTFVIKKTIKASFDPSGGLRNWKLKLKEI